MTGFDTLGSVSFNLAAAVIAVTCLFYTLIMRRKLRLKNILFLANISIIIINSVTVILGEIVLKSGLAISEHGKFIAIDILQFVYYFTHYAIAPFFALYIILVCNVYYRFSEKTKLLLVLPFYILEFLVISNPISHIVYSFNSKFELQRHFGVYLAYMQALFYIAFAIVALLLYWNTLNDLKRITLVYFFVISIIGTVIQLLYIDIKCELMCEAIGFMES